MSFKKIVHKTLVKARKFYYANILRKPRIILSESNLGPYQKKSDASYLSAFKN